MANYTINVVVSGAGGGGGTGSGVSTGTVLTSAVAGAALQDAASKQISVAAKPIEESMQRFAEYVQNNNRGASVTPLKAMPGGGYTATQYMGEFNKTWGTTMSSDIYRFTEPTQVRKQSLFRRALYETMQSNQYGVLDEDTGQYKYDKEQATGVPWRYPIGNAAIVDHAIKNQKRYGALAAAAAYKTIQSSVAVIQHQSGDAYQNQQINNGIKLAGYVGAIAFSGPLAGFVAAGIAVNEIANIVTGSMNYEFDRRLERQEITNTLALAGNASYGRNRGVGI